MVVFGVSQCFDVNIPDTYCARVRASAAQQYGSFDVSRRKEVSKLHDIRFFMLKKEREQEHRFQCLSAIRPFVLPQALSMTLSETKESERR